MKCKTIITFVLAMVTMFSMGLSTYGETTVIDSGICGATLDWELSSDGILTLTGSGEMMQNNSSYGMPWSEYSSQIKEVILPEGLTSISTMAFYGCDFTTIDIPNSVRSIGVSAFENTEVTEMVIPNSVITVGYSLFRNCNNLEKVTLGKNISLFDFSMFENCSKLKEIHYQSEVYPTFYASAILNVNAIVYYPEECENWKKYAFTDFTYVDGNSSVFFLEEGTALDFSDESYVYSFSPEVNYYTGTAKQPKLIIKNKTGVLPASFYSVTYGNNLYPGTATAWIEAKESHFSGSLRKNFEITKGINTVKTSISNDKVIICEENEYTLNLRSGIGDITYVSEDESVAIVDENGKIKGVAPGTTNIVITASGNEYYAEGQLVMAVTINEHIAVTDVAIDSTCIEMGLTEGSHCGRCKKILIAQECIAIDEENHAGQRRVKNEKKATCTCAGYTGDIHCADCDVLIESGEIIGLSDHQGGKATCMNKAVCDACHKEYGEINTDNHVGETEVRDIKKATCAEEGYTGDTYCKGCGAKLGTGMKCDKSNTHTWNEGIVTKEPTARETGEKVYTCTICKITRKEKIPAVGAAEVGSVQNSDDGTATYKVLVPDLGNGTVSYAKPTDKNAVVVIVPATVVIDGITYKVTAIEKNAFKNNKRIKSVTIGKNVTKIGDNAFYKCTALTKITIPSKVKTIGKNAFYGCKKNDFCNHR